ncbi:hypothetical protein NKG94_05710 [Micromonospora sp. M12]
MIASIRAAWFADRKRPAVWTVTLTWVALALVFGVGVPYLVHLALAGDPKQADDAASLLDAVLPGQLVPTGIGLFPLFGGAIVVILGAVVVGNEYRWGTLNLIFTQRPGGAGARRARRRALRPDPGARRPHLRRDGRGHDAARARRGRGLDWPPASDLVGASRRPG